jgi:hypothetical protein
MADQATHDPQLCTISIAGAPISGFASQDGFSVSYDSEKFTKLVGLRGLGAWNKNASNAATITLQLLASSANNATLAAIHLADVSTPGGILVPLIVMQQNSDTTVATGAVRVMKMPDLTVGAEMPTRTWMLGSLNWTMYVGGQNTTPIVSNMDDVRALIAAASAIPAAV